MEVATELLQVPAHEVPAYWPDVEPFIDRAMERGGRYDVLDIRKACLEGKMQLWIVYDEPDEIKAVSVTEILQYPRMKVFSIMILTGEDRESWVDHANFLMEQGRKWGCKRLEAWARPGWTRVMRDWRHTHSLLEIDL